MSVLYTDDGDFTGVGGSVLIAGILVATAPPMLLINYVVRNRIGPMWFWAHDVCPDPYVICGNIPVVIFVGAFLMSAMIAAWTVLLNYGKRRHRTTKADGRQAGGNDPAP